MAGLNALKRKTMMSNTGSTFSVQPKPFTIIEQYLHVSDFMGYIFDNADKFVADCEPGSPEFKSRIFDSISNLLIKVQSVVDMDKVSRIILEKSFHKQFIDLFVKNDIEGDDFEARQFLANGSDANLSFFTRYSRQKFLKAMITQAIDLQLYEVASELITKFLSIVLRFDSLPVIEIFIDNMKTNLYKYEARIHLLSLFIPIISRSQGEKLIETINDVINEPADANVYKYNINPLKVALMLYKLVDDTSK